MAASRSLAIKLLYRIPTMPTTSAGSLFFIFLFIACCSLPLPAQPLTGSLKGRVHEMGVGQPVALALVQLIKNDLNYAVATSESGEFTFENIPLGRYDVVVTHVGYLRYTQKDLLIEAGKTHFLEIALEMAPVMLADVEIRSKQPTVENERLGVETLRMEESQRLAGTFYDPGRHATAFPGVVSTNDQGNHVSIRGHSPNNVLWKIDGIDFVNPNHLTNAGTLSDRPSVSGGGVSILSAQLMDQSHLFKGIYPPGYGNALAGIFDIRLRRGSRDRNAFTLQAGFLGVEAAAEGPMGKDKQSGYIVNYRYSTIGLLTAMGLDVGDESINFQDLSFKVDLETGKAGKFSLFGLGGLSDETFNAERDPAAWENLEDRVDTRFFSDMGGLGLSHDLSLSSDARITNKVSYSAIRSKRTGNLVTDSLSLYPLSDDSYSQSLISWLIQWDYRLNKRHIVHAGMLTNRTAYDLNSIASIDTGATRTLAEGKDALMLYQPFVAWEGWIADTWKIDAGLHVAFTPFNSEYIVQPRITLTKRLPGDLTLKAHYGMVSQLNPPHAYFVRDHEAEHNLRFPNRDLGAQRSHQWTVGLHKGFAGRISLHTELYYQRHTQVPISTDSTSSYSILNATDGFINEVLTNRGTGKNIGVDIRVQKHFARTWYLTLATSAFDARYRAWGDQYRNTRFNARFSTALSGGKEFEKVLAAKKRIIGVNLRSIFHAGFWTTPFDLDSAEGTIGPVPDEAAAFSERLPAYFRTDLRLYFKVNKKRYTRTLSLDIQNVTNRKNVSYFVYDPVSDSVIAQYQLGILPFLSYRVEF